MSREQRRHHHQSVKKGKNRSRLQDIRYNIIWQPALCILYIWGMLYVMNRVSSSTILWAVGASSLASSAYLVFAVPKSHVAKAYRIIGGYIVAFLSAELVRIVFHSWFNMMGNSFFGANDPYVFWLAAACAVGLSLFLMVVMNYEHPPAAGLALVLVLELRDYWILLVILGSALALSIIKHLLRNHLKSLV